MRLAADLIVALTLLALIFLAAHQPTPAKVVQTDYCVVDRRVAGKDENGEWHFAWGKMYGPCSTQDIFRNI